MIKGFTGGMPPGVMKPIKSSWNIQKNWLYVPLHESDIYQNI